MLVNFRDQDMLLFNNFTYPDQQRNNRIINTAYIPLKGNNNSIRLAVLNKSNQWQNIINMYKILTSLAIRF